MMSARSVLYFSLFCLIFSFGDLYAQGTDTSERPFYEYKGNYGEEVATKKSKPKIKKRITKLTHRISSLTASLVKKFRGKKSKTKSSSRQFREG